MMAMTGAFFLAALIAPLIIRVCGRLGFAVLALVPAAGLVLSLTVAPAMLTGAEVWVESQRWLPALHMSLVFRMDALSWLFSLLVTGVGALVFLYCARYFDADELRLGRFAAVFMAFAGMMYGLILADEMLLMFIFWEGTTVFSYLLIGQYHSRQQTRRAALQALIVTTAGGLAMMVGIILLASVYGTGSLAAIVARGYVPGHGGLVITAVILILIGAVSKSALLPFHFWLPGAMAAPTPVSAYLHAAAMVKAGIYLVLRLAPGFAPMPGWHLLLLSLGIATMLVGAWQALRQNDLKLLLAYGTVSQLGFLTLIAAFGSRDITTAALALLLAHSLFKAALFLIVGMIDRRAGTRDLRKLSGYARCSPLLFTLAVISAASMAGLPPMLGFAAKEAVFTTLLEDGSKEAVIALIGAAAGSVLTVAYSARFVWGAFAVKPGVEPVNPGRGSPLLITAPAVLTVLTLTGGLASSALDGIIAAWTGQLPAAGHAEAYHLALWHGLEPALLLSLVVLAAGGLLFVFRAPVTAFQTAMPNGLDFHRGYRYSVSRLESFASAVTARTQRGSMPFYQGVIYIFAIITIVITLLLNNSWPGRITLADAPLQLLIATCLIIGAIAATTAQKRFAAVVVVGVTGYGMAAFFAHQGAPDLALTQALVETITIVVFVLVLRRLPARIGGPAGRFSPSLRLLIGAAFGITMMIVVFVALGARSAESIGTMFPQLAYDLGHGKNVVNVTLVDIRAWDTLGELSVVVAAATGVASFIFVRSREGTLQRIDANRPSVFSRLYRPVEDDLAPLWLEPDERQNSAVRRNAWLLAGRTLSPANRSIMLEVIVRLIFHAIIVFSVYLLFAGHNLPGGGFAAGLVAGVALALRYLAGGRYELAEAAPVDAGRLLGTGLTLAALTALGGLLWGTSVFDAAWLDLDVPLLGELHLGTSTLFDIGVYLIVIGLMLDILRSLGAEVDRHQESDERRLADSLSTEDTGPDTQQLHTLLGRMDDVDVDGHASGGRL